MYKIIAKLIQTTLRLEDKVNPRVIQFLLHYILGSQKEMTLTDREIVLSKSAVLSNIDFEQRKNIKNNIITIHGARYCEGFTRTAPESSIEGFLSHDLDGVVGAFSFDLDPITCEARCFDMWDFNLDCGTLSLCVDPANWFVVLICSALAHLFPSVFEYVDDGFFIEEGELDVFNKQHAFTTKWTVDLTGLSCPMTDDDNVPF